MRKSMGAVIVSAMVLAVWAAARAEEKKGHDSDKGHVMVRPADIKWGSVPPALPAGAKLAVLAGDPTKSAPFVIRIRMPDGYKVPPHWHPTDENVTVLKGTLMVGKGGEFSADASKALPVGSFVRMPKEMRHFAWAKGETIIQVHGMGPFAINYVNAADDPRKK